LVPGSYATSQKRLNYNMSPCDGINIQVAQVAEMESFPVIYRDKGSVSTFHQNVHNKDVLVSQPSNTFVPRIIPNAIAPGSHRSGILININSYQDAISRFSDAESRISMLESEFVQFNATLNEFKQSAKKEASENSKALKDILTLLEGGMLLNPPKHNVPSAQANHQDQLTVTSGSLGTAGTG